MSLTSLWRAIAYSALVLPSLATGIGAQTPLASSAPVEWTLDDVVRAAVSRHPLVEAARERVTGARGARQTAGTFSNPVATYWMENGTFPGHSAPLGLERETSAYLTVPLEPLFQRSSRLRHADADVTSAEINHAAARRQVALDAAHAFYRVALAQIAVEVAEASRSGLERLVSYNRSRVSEGGTAEVELLRVELELDRATANVTFAEVDLVKSQADLWPIVSAGGLNGPRVRLRVAVPNAGSLRATLAPQATFVTRAREHRSEVLGASARVAAATADTDLQRALTVRQVGATFGLKRVGGANSMIAGLSVPLPLFDRNRGEVQRADAELLAAEQERSWAERVVSAEIQAAYDGAERLSAEVSRLQPSFLNRAEDVNRITIGAYQEGAATLLQVIDAARTLGDARLTYFRAVIAQRQSVFDLAMAAGEEPEAALTASARTDTWLTRESLRAEDRQR